MTRTCNCPPPSTVVPTRCEIEVRGAVPYTCHLDTVPYKYDADDLEMISVTTDRGRVFLDLLLEAGKVHAWKLNENRCCDAAYGAATKSSMRRPFPRRATS